MNFTKNQKTTEVIFWALVLVSILIIIQFFVPVITDLVSGPIFLLPIAVFCLLGIALIIFTVKEKVKGKLKVFLMLTGISSAGFFICIVLHNLLYALGIISSQIVVLKYLFEILHVTFFLIATLGCPVGFLVGVVGSIVVIVKRKKK